MISVEKETLTLLYLPYTHTSTHTSTSHQMHTDCTAGHTQITTGRTLALPLSLYRSYSHSHPLLSTLTKGSQSSARCTQHPSSPHDRRLPAYTHTVYSHTSSPYYRYRRRQ